LPFSTNGDITAPIISHDQDHHINSVDHSTIILASSAPPVFETLDGRHGCDQYEQPACLYRTKTQDMTQTLIERPRSLTAALQLTQRR
jgi:hypothetical protein